MNKSTDLSRYAHSVPLLHNSIFSRKITLSLNGAKYANKTTADGVMELATCNDIEVTVVLLRTEEGVANFTARGRGSCDSVRWPWHSNTE
jgi:hypothetical protein